MFSNYECNDFVNVDIKMSMSHSEKDLAIRDTKKKQFSHMKYKGLMNNYIRMIICHVEIQRSDEY